MADESGDGGRPPDRPSFFDVGAATPSPADRDVFFRPTRYRAEDFAPLTLRATLEGPGGTRVHPVVRNLSQTGASVEWIPGLPTGRDDTYTFVLEFDEWRAWQGTVHVESVRDVDGRTLVGISFVEGLLNIAEALRLRDVTAWRPDAVSAPGKGSWQTTAGDHFKALVGELRLYLEDAEAWYTALEANIPWEVVHGDVNTAAHKALRARVMKEFVVGFVARSDAVNEAWLAVPEPERVGLTGFSRRHLQDHLLRSPLMRRALEKPLGYPGDYEVMGYMYDDHFAGHTLYAKALTLAILHTRSCIAVRTRKDLVRQRLLERIHTSRQPLRILSVAAGPAQEVFEIVHHHDTLPVPVQVVLFDQDPNALSRAFTRLREEVRRKPGLDVDIVFLKEDIVHPRVGVLTAGGAYDLIFSCGLFDYFTRPLAVSRARILSQCLGPGGELYIGNMVPESPARWMMELHLEWPLHYRSRGEMLEVGATAAPGATLRTVEEASGVNPFLLIQRA